MFQLSNSKWEENAIRTHNALPEDVNPVGTNVHNPPEAVVVVDVTTDNSKIITNHATPETTSATTTTTTSLSPGHTGDVTEENSADDEDSCESGNISRGKKLSSTTKQTYQ